MLEYLNGKVGYRNIARGHDLEPTLLFKWITKYRANGIKGLASKTGLNAKRQGRPHKLTTEVEQLKRELIKKEIEIARLKKGYLVKGAGAKKEFVTTFDVNTKSSHN